MTENIGRGVMGSTTGESLGVVLVDSPLGCHGESIFFLSVHTGMQYADFQINLIGVISCLQLVWRTNWDI